MKIDRERARERAPEPRERLRAQAFRELGDVLLVRELRMSVINDRFLRARQLARTLFPTWSRRMRAKWVIAKLFTPCSPKVAMSSQWEHDPAAFAYVRRFS